MNEVFWVWFDGNPKKDILDKILDAEERFKQKFDKKPLVCKINPQDSISSNKISEYKGELKILTNRTVPRNYIWLGEKE